ncbi:MAG: tRNA pseudouridine(55) synthase TruB [Bacilli bacterium]|nr:tRNA pseudouridine(55) synthase TruB [Bacilli bacterium]
MNGILLINKEKGMTSHDVVNKLRKILKTKKIGHCGTLDPMASGLLVCLVGQATKISPYLVLASKRYDATFRLGMATTTQDLEGEVVTVKEYQDDVSFNQLHQTLYNFIGYQQQTPSIYSAIKVNGKKLYEYARNNEEVAIPIRDILIEEIMLKNIKDNDIQIEVLCSSGTYIRTLCFDIAAQLNYPGVLVALERLKVGHFDIKDSYSLADVNNNNYELLDISKGLIDFDIVELKTDDLDDIKNGKSLNVNCERDFIVRINDEDVALYHKSINNTAKIIRGLWS